MKKFEASVVSPQQLSFSFSFIVHQREKGNFSLPDLYDGMSFSETLELEITNNEDIERRNEELKNVPLHIHKGINQRLFVCYPGQIQDTEEAKSILEMWSVMTAFQMVTGQEPNDFLASVEESLSLYEKLKSVHE